MPEFAIDSLDDPRLDPYRDLKQPASELRVTFIAEGEKLVRRLLESLCATESILCTSAARDRLANQLPAGIPVYLVDTPFLSRLIGFRFHRGVLACGRRPPEPSLESLLTIEGRSLIVVCPELRDPTNLGTIVRTAAAFGAKALIAGRSGTEPFSRRVLRTSMGTVLRLPIVQTDAWPVLIEQLHRHGYTTIATVLGPDAQRLSGYEPPIRAAVFFGNEDEGLSADLASRCRDRVTLPMALDVDSLNVAVAAGIALHHLAGDGESRKVEKSQSPKV